VAFACRVSRIPGTAGSGVRTGICCIPALHFCKTAAEKNQKYGSCQKNTQDKFRAFHFRHTGYRDLFVPGLLEYAITGIKFLLSIDSWSGAGKPDDRQGSTRSAGGQKNAVFCSNKKIFIAR
jgi:hypothetical protein